MQELFMQRMPHQMKMGVVAEAPEGSVSKVIYPIGIIKTTTKPEAKAQTLVDFLQSDEVIFLDFLQR